MIRFLRTCTEVLDLLSEIPPPYVIEVSTGEDYQRGHLPGAIQLSLHEVGSDFADHCPDSSRPVLIYGINDQSPDTLRAARLIHALGYPEVDVYLGGKNDWQRAGLDLETFYYRPEPQPLRDLEATIRY